MNTNVKGMLLTLTLALVGTSPTSAKLFLLKIVKFQMSETQISKPFKERLLIARFLMLQANTNILFRIMIVMFKFTMFKAFY